MKALVLYFLLLLSAALGAAQTATPTAAQTAPAATATAPDVANYSIMLVSPTGGAVVLMHNPKNQLEYIDVSRTKEAFAAGYIPVRTAEISDLLTGLSNEIMRLRTENARLTASAPVPASSAVSPSQAEAREQTRAATEKAEIEARQEAQAAALRSERRQQLLQAWMMLQAARPQQYQLPMPAPMQVVPYTQMRPSTCTTQRIGDTAYTNCN